MKVVTIGTRIKVNKNIGIVIQENSTHVCIKFECGQFVFKRGFEDKHILN